MKGHNYYKKEKEIWSCGNIPNLGLRKLQGRGAVYVAGLSRSKFAGALMVVESCLRREKCELVIVDVDVIASVSLGGWRYWGERDGGVMRLYKTPWRSGMIAKSKR